MADKGRNINGEEQSLWDRFVAGINPIKKQNKTPSRPHKEPVQKTRKTIETVTTAPPVQKIKDKSKEQLLDRRTLNKLQSGKMEIEGRIDLHGKNQDQAYHALKGFLSSSFAQQKRCVLVITGKGGRHKQDHIFSSIPEGQGILKTRLPQWLSQPPLSDIVLRLDQAQEKHGGGGAFYVYLKKQRTP